MQNKFLADFRDDIMMRVLYPEEYKQKDNERLLEMLNSGDYVLVDKKFYEERIKMRNP